MIPARRYGHKFGATSTRDRPIGALVGAPAPSRPDSLTFENLVDVVRDQGNTSSCEGQGWSSAVFLRAAIAGAPIEHPSAAALYALALESDQGPKSPLLDEGTYARTIAYILATEGVCAESRWTFDRLLEPGGANVARPPWDVLQAGSDARITGYAAVLSTGAQRCSDLRDALAKGFPVTFGAEVDQAFEDGQFETYGGLTGPSLGGHCMCIVGYEPGRFRILNSWGPNWNDHGFYWASDSWIGSDTCSDFWSLDVAPKVVR